MVVARRSENSGASSSHFTCLVDDRSLKALKIRTMAAIQTGIVLIQEGS